MVGIRNIGLLILAVCSVGLALPVAPSTNLQSQECDVCEGIVKTLANLWGDATLEDCTFELMAYVCTAMRVVDNFVCRGLVSDFKDTFIYVINETVHDPPEVCGLIVAGCDGAFDPFNATWSIPIPDGKPPHKEYPPVPAGKPTLKVLHISDIHVDDEYIIGAEADCGEMMCCRPPQDDSEGKAAVKRPAGKWGTYGNCDAPYWLFKDMIENIAAKHKQEIDYVVVSGDLESHADWGYTRAGHQAKVRNISRLIKEYLPGINVYFAQGNHETVPMDAFAPSWTPEEYHMDWMYGTEAEEWKEWLVTDDALKELNFNGCYMKQLYPGLRLISLNNILGNSYNIFMYINQTDPDGTMTWLANQLLDAERAGDKVQIVAHMPGGGGESLEGWSINYYNLVNRFEDTVIAQFFGHTHSEEHYMFYEDPEDGKSRPTGYSLSAPSVTPNFAYNPAYRMYTLDGNYPGSSFQIIDFEEYFLNLTEANANPDAPTNWQLLYSSAKEQYGLKDMSPAEWDGLINRMWDDDKLFAVYQKNIYRRTDNGIKPCTGGCKHSTLCSLKASHHSKNLCKDMQFDEETVDPNKKQKKDKRKLESFDPAALMKSVDVSKIRKFDSGKCPI